ncbi:hypothetical protein J1N35_000120 [Gossypium stocksii]|uniref:Reverse transcriptase zinc-binding domain-containing protein n=1 Tax=Gossypium stocksii TaxID=47602 RepID=A0A9D3WF45_9ROSI|nr:hypothetical protein J1N35_000120 [Gossypium stocksii]
MKLDYHLLVNTKSLWVWVLKKKYNVQGELLNFISRRNCSFIWKSFSRVWPEVVGNVFWSISDGRMMNFWDDVWVRQMGPLRDILGGPDQPDNTLRVCDLVTDNGFWDWDRLTNFVLRPIIRQIAAIIPHLML